MKAELTNENIVRATEEVKKFLEERKAEAKEVIRIRISIEEVLVAYQQEYGEDGTFELDLGKRLGKEVIRLRIHGREFDPFAKEDGDSDEMAYLQGYLKHMGMLPRWSFRHGINEILYLTEKKRLPDWAHLVIAIVSAIITGIILRNMPSTVSGAVLDGLISPLLKTFMGFLNTISGPLIFLTVFSGVRSAGDASTFSRVGKRISLLFGVFLFIMTVIAVIPFTPFYKLDFGASGVGDGFSSLFQMILDIVPRDIFTPFTEGNTLQILFLAIIAGVTTLLIEKDLGVVSALTDQIGYIVNRIIGAVSRIIPFFVFGSLVNIVVSSGYEFIISGGKFLLTVVSGCVLVLILHTAVVSIWVGMSPLELWKKDFSPFLISLTTASSGAAFNESMTACVDKLGIDKSIVDFGLPFGMVIYMPGAAVLHAPGEGERNRRAAHEDEEGHYDVPEREALPAVLELGHYAVWETPYLVRGMHKRGEERKHHHVEAAEQIEREQPFFRFRHLISHVNGGEEEIRTLDPHVANVMLYQLSYFPNPWKRRIVYQKPPCARKGVIFTCGS